MEYHGSTPWRDMMDEDKDTRVVIPKDIVTKNTDGRGRITLGSEYANKRVTLAVVDVEEIHK